MCFRFSPVVADRMLQKKYIKWAVCLLAMLAVLHTFTDVTFPGDQNMFHIFTSQRDIRKLSENENVTSVSPEANTHAQILRNTQSLAHKRHHIGLLKVHKTGSTTIQNILFRFGLNHNLTFTLPKQDNYNYLYFKRDVMPVARGNHFDMFAVHTIYDQQMLDDLLPSDSVNIGIVRDPLKRMVSAAFYYRDVFSIPYLMRIPRKNFIKELVNNPDKYEKLPFSETKNSMGKDFGFSSKLTINDNATLLRNLETLKARFRFVIVMEQFEESLVLMRRSLNWSLTDIIYIPSNSHTYRDVELTSTEKAKLRQTCFLDYAIYELFVDIFEEKRKTAGDDFNDEVIYFISILSTISEFCTEESRPERQVILQMEKSRWNEQFNVTKNDCALMKTKEMEFINILKARHRAYNKIPSVPYVFLFVAFITMLLFLLLCNKCNYLIHCVKSLIIGKAN